MTSAYISEIYTSIQGEGLYTGERQIFLRFAGCPLRCDFCDTPDSLTALGHPSMTVAEVQKRILDESGRSGVKTISLTGGEPLVQVHFLKELLPLLKNGGFNIYLETAGTHPQFLSEISNLCDVIAMDIKLPSATGQVYWKEHAEFLNVSGQKAFVKIVIEEQSKMNEFEQALHILQSIQPVPRLILQPVTPIHPQIKAPNPEQIAAFFSRARSSVPFVLVMPQQHPMWGIH